MLNNKNERELAYLVKVEEIIPMNADRLECARVGGWHCVVGKGEFKAGDLAVYFEIDSKLPEVEPFNSMAFLVSKHYKIKSQKIRGVVSQGLLVHPSTLGWTTVFCSETNESWVVDKSGNIHVVEDESRFLTEKLGVTYAVIEDNTRKASSTDKYKKMAQRHPKLARKVWWRWLMRRKWGKKVLYALFGKKKDKKSEWPTWVVKTDEERVQNMPFLFPNDTTEWIATEKIDGTSTTFTMRGFGHKRQFYVCSRNVVFDKPDKKCYYDSNYYLEMEQQYSIKEKLARMMDIEKQYRIEFITLQGETFGEGVQKNSYSMIGRELRIFNVIFGYNDGTVRRLNPIAGKVYLEEFDIPFVPIVYRSFFLPPTCDELLEIAKGVSRIDGGMREGLVFRSCDGTKSFKAVSNEYLLKYHG